MKYKVGQRVKVKSLQWFNENSDDNHNVIFADGWYFTESMSIFCGKELIIEKISRATNPPHYIMKDNIFAWTDEMIEGLVEEETKSNIIEEAKTYWDSIKDAWICPEGYQFVDEDGNVINATKIVLEKKKKEYPKTYDGCEKILGLEDSMIEGCLGYEYKLLNAFQKLLMCRDAYWKIAGEEMGLGKPWKPDWDNVSDKYCIYFVSGYAWSKECQTRQCPFAFPTPEMRDAFKENFDTDIEFCKELL